MKSKEVKEIFVKEIGETPVSIIDSSKGVDQLVKIIKTKESVYVFKHPQRDFQMIFNEWFATNQCAKKGLPVPKVLVKTKKYLIESLIEGKELSSLKLPFSEKKKIYFQIGKLMKIMHSIKTKGYGNFTDKGVGKFKNLKEHVNYLEKKMEANIALFSKKKLFSKKDMDKIKEYKKKISIYDCKSPVLNHADVEEDHIFVKNGKISGIIDFADLESDDPMMDFTRLYVRTYDSELFQSLKKGYGKVDMNKIKFFTFYFLLWRLNYSKKKDNYHKRMIHCMHHLINN